MNYIGIIVAVVSHIFACLYMQKQKYSKLATACAWGSYTIFTTLIALFTENVVLGFFVFLIPQFLIFHLTSEGSIGENMFLFLTYANSFCIFIGASCLLSAFFGDNVYLTVCSVGILILIHLFLYKCLIPSFNKSKIFFPSGWRKLNLVLILFLIQFLKQYAFKIVDKSSAINLLFDFIIFSVIFYSALLLLFNLVKDVAEKNKKAIENKELKSVAYIDSLTNVQNRLAYEKFTKKQSFKLAKNSNKNVLFVIMDIDDFKNINDTKGHAAGDEVLKQVGAFITRYFESPDCESFRIGGDEFVLLIEDMPLSAVEAQIKKMNCDLDNSIGVTLSYGCSAVDFNKSNPFDMAFKVADEIMYSNKQQKKTHS